jgi:hypothetical protein
MLDDLVELVIRKPSLLLRPPWLFLWIALGTATVGALVRLWVRRVSGRE